ncbi:hypothetical protein Dimus_030905 [Dionaea muscipula]
MLPRRKRIQLLRSAPLKEEDGATGVRRRKEEDDADLVGLQRKRETCAQRKMKGLQESDRGKKETEIAKLISDLYINGRARCIDRWSACLPWLSWGVLFTLLESWGHGVVVLFSGALWVMKIGFPPILGV